MITIEDLKARPLSYSSLKEFAKSPEHFIHYRESPRKDTAAFIFGDLLDTLLLTPEQYDKKFIFGLEKDGEKLDKRSAANKEAWAAFYKANEGKRVISKEEHAEAKTMVKKINKNKHIAEKLKREGEAQKTIRWTDHETGLPCIAKLDKVTDNAILELKSTQDANPDNFPRDCFKFKYHIQTGMYMRAVREKRLYGRDYHIIAIEKSEPYGVALYKPTANFLKAADQEVSRLLQAFKYCMDENLWNQSYEFGHPFGSIQLDLPYYARKND